MAKISKKLEDAVSPLTATQLEQLVEYARTLQQHSAARKIAKPKRTSRRPSSVSLEDTRIGKLILRLESNGDIGLPADFGSQVDHYIYGTSKRYSCSFAS
ncbi:MAG: hypothetical protein QM703_07505 [Gemmatales bacterium]